MDTEDVVDIKYTLLYLKVLESEKLSGDGHILHF